MNNHVHGEEIVKEEVLDHGEAVAMARKNRRQRMENNLDSRLRLRLSRGECVPEDSGLG